MDQLIQAFGIDVKLITVQIINFVIVLGLLSYFLYKPVLKMLSDREEKIAQGIKDAESAAQAKADADAEKQTVLSAAHKEAGEISDRATAHADQKAAEITKAADDKATAIVQAAQAKSEELKAQAHKESESEIAKLAVLAAEKVLRKESA